MMELYSPNVTVLFFLETFPHVLLLQSTEIFGLICLSYMSNVIVIYINVLKIKSVLKFLNKVPLETIVYTADLNKCSDRNIPLIFTLVMFLRVHACTLSIDCLLPQDKKKSVYQ